jgi:branched-subunit amino acid transport protein
MTPTPTFWLAIVLSGLVTYTVRSVMFLVAGRMTALPANVREVLRMIPAAALAALAIPPLLRPGGAETALHLVSPELLAGVVAGLVAWRWRNLLATIAAGLAAVLLLQPLLG